MSSSSSSSAAAADHAAKRQKTSAAAGGDDAAAFQLGPQTFRVPMSMHRENRQRLVSQLKQLPALPTGALVLLEGGKLVNRYDTDVELLFRQESFFQYLFGVKEPSAYGAIEVDSGKTHLFMERLPAEYAVWMGAIEGTESMRARYGVDAVHYADTIAEVVAALQPSKVLLLDGVNSDSGLRAKAAEYEGLAALPCDKELLYPTLVECRVIKSKQELELLRAVNRVSSEAHKEVMRRARPGMAEFELESRFLHETYSKGGCRFTAYTCICGSGNNGSVLHYGHQGAANDKVAKDGDMCLFDMGGEYHCYASDITCSFPVNGKFTDDQKIVYNAVKAANDAVQAAMKPGVAWKDMHRLSERAMASELLKAGLLCGELDELCKHHIPALFQPHGLGHLMGLDVHDVGGYPAGTQRSTEPGLKSLRCGRTLEAGMVITVEPGCYFIDVLLDPALADPVKAQFLNADVLARFRGTGGVRIEDDVIVTPTGCENMTKVPRSVEEIEALMAEGRAMYGDGKQ